jgi:hypothetical protein
MAAKDMRDALQNPHPEVPFASVGDDTVKALADLAAIYKTQNTASSVPCDPSFACHSHSMTKPDSLTNPNLTLAHSRQAANEITNDNSHSRHPQSAITTEGGHTSEGAHWVPRPLTTQPVSR